MRSTTITSTTAFLSTYLAQVVGSVAIVASYFLIPLNLGPRRYAEFISLVGIGYLAPALVDQVLNTILAFNVGRGSRNELSNIAFSKVVATTMLAVLFWFALSRSGLVLAFTLAFAIAFALSNTLDTWLIATGRTLPLAIYKMITATAFIGALIIATRQGPVACAVTLFGYYLIGAIGCVYLVIKYFEFPRLTQGHVSGLGAAGPMIWFPVYSWLLPLILLSARYPVAASNAKLAIAILVGLSLFAPVPTGLLTVAVAARQGVTNDLAAAIRRTLILAWFAGIIFPVALFANYGLFAALLSHFGYETAATQAIVASLALYPLLTNPMLCARLYAAGTFAWGPVAGYAAVYGGTLIAAAFAPGVAVPLIPVGHWLLLFCFAIANRELLVHVARRVDGVRVATVTILALPLIGVTLFPLLASVPIRLALTAALSIVAVWLATPYLTGRPTPNAPAPSPHA